jgi:hypothetical protein
MSPTVAKTIICTVMVTVIGMIYVLGCLSSKETPTTQDTDGRVPSDESTSSFVSILTQLTQQLSAVLPHVTTQDN